MGFDLYGKSPVDERGKYFRAMTNIYEATIESLLEQVNARALRYAEELDRLTAERDALAHDLGDATASLEQYVESETLSNRRIHDLEATVRAFKVGMTRGLTRIGELEAELREEQRRCLDKGRELERVRTIAEARLGELERRKASSDRRSVLAPFDMGRNGPRRSSDR